MRFAEPWHETWQRLLAEANPPPPPPRAPEMAPEMLWLGRELTQLSQRLAREKQQAKGARRRHRRR
jgi:hypothetical protein